VKTKDRNDRKVFINVCQSNMVARATAATGQRSDNKGGYWTIPYSLTTVREDIDHGNIFNN